MLKKDSTLFQGINDAYKSTDYVQSKRVYLLLQEAKSLSLQFATNAYSFWYGTSNLFLMCSIIFGILTFLIAKGGWDNNNNFYLRASFLIFFLASSYFGLVPEVFNNKETGKFYLNKYTAYDNLQIDVYNFIKADSLNKNNTGANLDSILNRYKEINNIYFELKTQNVPKELKIPN